MIMFDIRMFGWQVCLGQLKLLHFFSADALKKCGLETEGAWAGNTLEEEDSLYKHLLFQERPVLPLHRQRG